MIIAWLLMRETNGPFRLRQVAADLREARISIGLIQRVFHTLVYEGILKTDGLRTAKTFAMHNPADLLQQWLNRYSIRKKCRMWTYSTALSNQELKERLLKSRYTKKVVWALHSAARESGFRNTNLETVEIYLLDPQIRTSMEKLLSLYPEERGCQVLLINPYYKTALRAAAARAKTVACPPPLYTFIDLYHFPLRGEEQAESIARRIHPLSEIYRKIAK
ncbi:MAG TPA: hypothetical protein DCS07_00810 [Bdellovibrionales bacterium]|nr:MAG: hypothetical protein A2Z97_04120 [Bdellovibrionales bacterium GWB1_52_6]OFZ02421.1 MAG: hypothetical protein A2X97_12795 [Bdellovibrionales bacterium GWA1_52_35]OFZ34351.1 MAG: hypothetical protein A2070_03030 [Bdellovibrionales bacterium GWC1_52_8]HAR41170.1 hypothetical protein [Bdellovibrionales bacterium]HCM41550.1 hypothetical protein [Bdellovibrionales bacterium]